MRAGLAGLAGLAVALVVAGCSLLPAPVDTGPAPPPGVNVVPPERMTLNVSNGSTLPVSLVVNGTSIAVVQPQDGINEMPAAQLPALPWAVEIRSPTGRVLVVDGGPRRATSGTVGTPTAPARRRATVPASTCRADGSTSGPG